MLTVIDTKFLGDFSWAYNGGLFIARRPCGFRFICIRNGVRRQFRVDFREGAETDGLSVPRLFRWFLPVWEENNPEYSMVGATHDALYATAGFGGIFTREDSDDFLRGGLRCAHKDRERAGIADMAVRLLACRHWGAAADTHDLRDYVTVTEETA
jgi:hypothetical protein